MNNFKKLLGSNPEKIEFDMVMQLIANYYNYTPTRFTNGVGNDQITSEAGCEYEING